MNDWIYDLTTLFLQYYSFLFFIMKIIWLDWIMWIILPDGFKYQANIEPVSWVIMENHPFNLKLKDMLVTKSACEMFFM